jgi:hypothetical protein
MQTSTSKLAEEQLNELRMRVREIRIAKKWLQEYRVNAPVGISQALTPCYTWLDQQEQKTIAMGKRINSR